MTKAPTWLRTLVVALITLLVGVFLLWLGDRAPAGSGWRILALNTGSFVVASLVMALIFQFWQLRGLLNDLRSEAGITEEYVRSGIRSFTTAFHAKVPWPELFASSSRVRIAVAYAQTWRRAQQDVLEEFLSREGTELEVVLPDPEVEVVLNEMALRYAIAPAELRMRIEKAAEEFTALEVGRKGTVSVYFLSRSLLYTCYLFDNEAVFTTYRHRPDRGPIVTLRLDKKGDFYVWLSEEWAVMAKHGVERGTTRLFSGSDPASGE